MSNQIMKQLSEILANFINYLKQLYEHKLTILQEEQQYIEQQKQQLAICSNYNLVLDAAQIEQLTYYSFVTLYPLQSADISLHFIRQSVATRDTKTLQYIRAELGLSLNQNIDFIRLLHQELYESFIHAYYPNLTYANVAPPDVSFWVCNQGYGFLYTLTVDSKKKFSDVKTAFQRYRNTQACQELFRTHGIQSANLDFTDDNFNLIIFLK